MLIIDLWRAWRSRISIQWVPRPGGDSRRLRPGVVYLDQRLTQRDCARALHNALSHAGQRRHHHGRRLLALAAVLALTGGLCPEGRTCAADLAARTVSGHR